ncbi:MAG: PIN domain-containing protein [Promethearchaeota archaeon]
MKKFFVDSVIWIAAFLRNDNHHQKGKLFLEWFEKQDKIKIIINDHIISEIAAHMRKKAKSKPLLINKIIDIFYEDPRIEIYYTSEENFNLAIEIFKNYEKLSLVDSIIVYHYLNNKIEYLISFDSGFDSYREINRIVDPTIF